MTCDFDFSKGSGKGLPRMMTWSDGKGYEGSPTHDEFAKVLMLLTC